jgi:3-oxoacyl-[acyl-carrier protein] reductase
MCSRDAERIERAARAVGGIGLVADVSDRRGAVSFMDEALARLGGVDILVLNSGGSPPSTALATEPDSLAAATEQQVIAPIVMLQRAIPSMRAAGWGRVVSITSIAVRRPIPTLTLSNTTRSGLTAYLKTLSTEVAPDGITVNTVQPGYHATSRLTEWAGDRVADLAASVPAGRLGQPNELGATVAFLCSEQAGFITGANIPIDGGEHGALP